MNKKQCKLQWFHVWTTCVDLKKAWKRYPGFRAVRMFLKSTSPKSLTIWQSYLRFKTSMISPRQRITGLQTGQFCMILYRKTSWPFESGQITQVRLHPSAITALRQPGTVQKHQFHSNIPYSSILEATHSLCWKAHEGPPQWWCSNLLHFTHWRGAKQEYFPSIMEKQQTHPNKTGHQSHEQPPPKLPIKGRTQKVSSHHLPIQVSQTLGALHLL